MENKTVTKTILLQWEVLIVTLLTYLLTYSLTYLILIHKMEQSPSLEANRFLASQEIPHTLWNPKVHYRIHKCPPRAPILSRLNPFQASTSHFLKIHLNIILPSTSWSPQWSLSLRFLHLQLVHTSPFLHACHMPRPSHSSRFYHPHNIWVRSTDHKSKTIENITEIT
jgi:hypothetical protein